MAISVNVTKKLDNGFVQVEAIAQKNIVRNYKVPETSADSFCKEYQNNNKKLRKRSNIIDFVLSPIVAVSSLLLLGKTKAGTTLKVLGCIGLTMVANYAGSIINNNKYVQKKQEIISKYNATEIDTQEDAFDKVLK